MKPKLFLLVPLLFNCIVLLAQKPHDIFDQKVMAYSGLPSEQAKILLRKVEMWGKITEKSANIHPDFLALLDANLPITKLQMKAYLKANKVTDDEVGGNIDNGISAIMHQGTKIQARYFVIHDMSTPTYKKDFPSNINDSTWKQNNLDSWKWPAGKVPSHMLVTRTGKSKTLADFSTPWRATRFESSKYQYGLGEITKGLFIHIELVQPRVFPPGDKESAPVAPTPGFTDVQYQKLALLYVCASVRRGSWLVPAFHGNIDDGIAGGHDDPQNFELGEFTKKVLELVSTLKKQP